MAKTLKVERKHFIECGEELPAFLVTVDTEIPSDSDANEVLDSIISEQSDFVFCPQGISTYEILKAASIFQSEDDIPKSSTWDRIKCGENVCKAGKFLFDNSGSKFIVAGVEETFASSMGSWLVVFWCISFNRATEWHF